MLTTTHPDVTIGVIGCGSIAETYLRNAALFSGISIKACSDIETACAVEKAERFGIAAVPVDELLADPGIDLILNLTVPAVHLDVSLAILRAGKHVYTEKPLGVSVAQGRQLVEEANRRHLMIGSAPDTFLGAAGRHARRLIDAGAIGKPVTGTAFMMGRGMEHWHPDPRFYYQPGAGPLFDMGPYYLTSMVNLLGPIERVVALSCTGQQKRLITAEGPLQNTLFDVGTPTSVQSVLEFRSGAIVSFGTSWDVFRHANHPIELHGTDGSLRLPDPDTFGGVVSVSARGEPWVHHDTAEDIFGRHNWPPEAPDRANYRMLAVADMALALRQGMQPRVSATLALHVLEVMEAIATASTQGRAINVHTELDQPMPLSVEEALALTRSGESSTDR